MSGEGQEARRVALGDALLLTAMLSDGDAQIVRAAAECVAAELGGPGTVELAACMPLELGRSEFDGLIARARAEVELPALADDQMLIRTAQGLARAWVVGSVPTGAVLHWARRLEEGPADLYDLWHLWASDATYGLDRRAADEMLAQILTEIVELADPWAGASTS